ncbi:MAG: hypothetical protein LQ342_003567 [Letrouitia transgressa]|nr:MAG: hypothetical protein LQ342_003567 [Letrouitia transgressa]
MNTPILRSKSPLSPRNANSETPITLEKKLSHKSQSPPPFTIHLDTENVPTEQTGGLKKASSRTDIRQSPSKHKSPTKYISPKKAVVEREEPVHLTKQALRENEVVAKKLEMTSGGDSLLDLYGNNDVSSIVGTNAGYQGMDDTCFSTFSAVPNVDMTLFAQIGPSPAKHSSPAKRSREAQYSEAPTPRPSGRTTPGFNGRSTPATSRHPTYDECSPSPTPRRPNQNSDGETTNLILDFTEQFSAFSQTAHISSSRQEQRPLPRSYNTQPDLASYAADRRSSTKHYPATPSKLHSLLDFDLPPAPTPRSIPTITARELESLKSSFLSQISSLRATLSGKEAEVNHLKTAVEDAERRVGEAQESIREERGAKESLQADKTDWEARDKEMQSVLRGVKEEIIHEQHELEKLGQKLETSDRKREEAEAKLVEAESKIIGLQSTINSNDSAAGATCNETGAHNDANGDPARGPHIEAAVEKVARELHALYRSKHENKVSALKKSYEARWEKRVRELESCVATLRQENEELRVGRDATMSGVVVPPNSNGGQATHASKARETGKKAEEAEEKRSKVEEEHAARIAEIENQLRGFETENTKLKLVLEGERREMAELVKATEEMMSLSSAHSGPSGEVQDQRISSSGSESLKGSFSKASAASGSGLKQPGTGLGVSIGGSKIGRVGRSASGLGGGGASNTRSGIMSSIERMGRGRSANGEAVEKM